MQLKTVETQNDLPKQQDWVGFIKVDGVPMCAGNINALKLLSKDKNKLVQWIDETPDSEQQGMKNS